LALGYLHANNIIHRDLKLENILLEEDGYIVIADFGLSKILSHPDEQTGTFVGTPVYLAPEVLDKRPYDRTIDWWALGILVYELLHGYPPFYDRN
jgi:serine/threonine protein kinase